MKTVHIDRSNKVAYAVGAPDGYTAEEYDAIRGSASMYVFAARAVFQGDAIQLAREIAGPRQLLVHHNLLHGRLPGYSTPWVFDDEKRAFTDHAIALNTEGEPAVRFKNKNAGEHQYHVNATGLDPALYAKFIAEWVGRTDVDGVLIDNLVERPWTYPEDPALPFENVGGPLWQSYQVAFVWHLRSLLGPGAVILANGRWAMEEPALVSDALLSGVFWERCGTHWWSPQRAAGLMHYNRNGIHVYDGRPGSKGRAWDMPQFSQTMAIVNDQYAVVGPGHGEVLV